MDLQVDGEADVVGHVVLSHVHNVVQLVGNLLRGFLFIGDRPASLQDATTQRARAAYSTTLCLELRGTRVHTVQTQKVNRGG